MTTKSTSVLHGESAETDHIFLGDLSVKLSHIKHREQMFDILFRYINDYMRFACSTLFVLNNDRNIVSNYFSNNTRPEVDAAVSNDKTAVRLSKNCSPFTDDSIAAVTASFNLEDIPQVRCIKPYLKSEAGPEAESGFIINLVIREKAFAQWIIIPESNYVFKKQRKQLLLTAANMLGLALSNLMAEEMIIAKDTECEILQALNMDFASIVEKNDLLKIIRTKLRKLFDFGYHWLTVLNEDQLTMSTFLQDSFSDVEAHPCYHEAIKTRYSISDYVFSKIWLSENAQIFDLEELHLEGNMPDYMQILYNSGIKKTVMIGLQVSCRIIGTWTICLNEKQKVSSKQLNYVKNVSNQIALSISNIMANEKVISQLTEINNYKLQLEEEKIYLKEEIETTMNYSEMVGESAAIQKAFRLVSQVSSSDSTVLILGETGTGKELIARAIHNSSPRRGKLMVKVNCAALPANLIESELFGHERGSFTGATERRLGKFELANKGTLFLDEIGEMPLDLQVKLLRALQEKEIERVGGKETIKVDVRIIAATNRDLEKEMAEGRFRSDLYYRLNVFPITLPPLRARKEDIPNLALYFIQRYAKKTGKEIAALSNRVMQDLVRYNWPGNIRELEHVIERSILLTNGDAIKQIHLPDQRTSSATAMKADEFVIKTIDENEREFILKTLSYCNGRIGGVDGAAQLLGVPTSTLNSKIKRLGIRKKHEVISNL